MPSLERRGLPMWSARTEWLVYCTAMAFSMLAIPLYRGEMNLNWDALNHHIYLGWVADRVRFDRDFWAAGSQSYQYPYLYWPVYRLYMSTFDGRWVGVIWVGLHTLAVPPVYWMVRLCISGETWDVAGMRFAALLLSFLSPVLVAYSAVTSNDVLACIPLLWAMALAFSACEQAASGRVSGLLCLSGLLAGISVAFKWSNGPLAICLPLLWLWSPGTPVQRLRRCFLAGCCTVLACALTYLPWGWQLWREFGNPFYPFMDEWVAPLRDMLGWTP